MDKEAAELFQTMVLMGVMKIARTDPDPESREMAIELVERASVYSPEVYRKASAEVCATLSVSSNQRKVL